MKATLSSGKGLLTDTELLKLGLGLLIGVSSSEAANPFGLCWCAPAMDFLVGSSILSQSC